MPLQVPNLQLCNILEKSSFIHFMDNGLYVWDTMLAQWWHLISLGSSVLSLLCLGTQAVLLVVDP